MVTAYEKDLLITVDLLILLIHGSQSVPCDSEH